MVNKRVLIDAIYINNSGGKVLLDYLIQMIINSKYNEYFYFLLDKRGEYDCLNKINYEFGISSERFRYLFYKKNRHRYAKVLCFGNVPPPICLKKSTVYVYFHNVLLAESLNGYPIKSKILKYLKRIYIKLFIKNINEVFVQSNYVKKIFSKYINKNIKISLFPFYNLNKNEVKKVNEVNEFVYVSNGNPHKNHRFLLDVWEKLFELGYCPVLNLTITENYKVLIDRIKRLESNGLKIRNFGYTNINDLFAQSNYLIYPSLKESFGLGLVEGVNANLKVIGVDLPYTYEVIKPSLTFNPKDVEELVDKIIAIIENRLDLEESKIVVENKIDKLLQKLLK